MYQSDENNRGWSGVIMSDIYSWLRNPVSDLISQIQTMTTREQISSAFFLENCLEESSDSLNQLEDCRSVTLMPMLDFKNISKLFSVTMFEEENPTLFPLDDQVESMEGAADSAEEGGLSVLFESKYINFFPLYQDFFMQPLKENLHSMNKSVVSELITPQYAPGRVGWHSEATSLQLSPCDATPPSPSTPPVHRVTPYPLWQGLEEVKASELITPQYAQALQSCYMLGCHSEATSLQLSPCDATPPSTPPVHRVTPYPLWQGLEEVKASELITPQYAPGMPGGYSKATSLQLSPCDATPPSPSPSTPPVHRVTPYPLWQGLEEVKASELITPQYAQGLQYYCMPGCPAEATSLQLSPCDATSPSTPPVHRVSPYPLWQDLGEVKASELITPQYAQGLQTRYRHGFHSKATILQLSPRDATPPSPSTPPVRRVTPCLLWQDLKEVKASGLLSSLTTKEIRLQETMFELIVSEESYQRSLEVAVKHFFRSKALKQTLSPMEHHILFSNIHHVMAASEKFMMDLKIRLKESVLICQVGDVVLRHCPDFRRLYVPYVTNMRYQEALVNQLLQQNRNFLCEIKKLESDPVCQRQSLKSFLVLPFQRITRIKLILEGILKVTKPGSDSVLNLDAAIEAIHEVVTECDNRVRKMKQVEELVCLETLMDFGKVKSVPLVVSGRFLVHHGPVRQLTVQAGAYKSRVSFIRVYLHVFNDLLIISLKKDQRFTVVDYAKFPTCVHLEHLKTEVLGLPPDSFLLHLSQCHTGQSTAMVLVPSTRADKEEWIKALSTKH